MRALFLFRFFEKRPIAAYTTIPTASEWNSEMVVTLYGLSKPAEVVMRKVFGDDATYEVNPEGIRYAIKGVPTTPGIIVSVEPKDKTPVALSDLVNLSGVFLQYIFALDNETLPFTYDVAYEGKVIGQLTF